ncbi:Ypt of gyp1p [Venustampulla echinocandica]|uniref:Ypt of gyp1p n=1 Tax=Venustampulla echinocandica TaxID=2656787 RepID=A0A370U3K2_9HELO|nr:Ypt of gyp1p [Venustampulla echinocandica]RDL42323.1 Ypt of gyp1p [Venustampulla echinocandica]
MDMPNGQYGWVAPGRHEVDSEHLRKQRSHQAMKFSLYPSRAGSRPRTASNTSGNASPVSPVFPTTPTPPPQRPGPRIDPLRSNSYTSNYQRPSTSHQITSNDGSRSYTSSPQPQQPLHERPSEASRLRALNSGYRSHSTEGRRTPDLGAGNLDNLSRPRELNSKHKKDTGRPLVPGSSTVPSHTNTEIQPHPDPSGRDRGLSTSSSQSLASSGPIFPLRPSMSIPDYHAPDSIYSRQRNLNNSSYRPGKVISRPDSNYSSHWREPMMRSATGDGEEVRASFRSALTTNSSFLGTSGTERSSIMTKSSSATSIFGRDEGMSVDDAIGMYESGFHDSGTEDLPGPRRRSIDSDRGKISEFEAAVNQPFSHPTDTISRDPHIASRMAAINTPGLQDKPELNGSLDAQPTSHTKEPPYRPATRAAPPRPDGSRDRYGFRKNTQHVPLAEYEAWNGPYTEHLARRRKKWVALLKDNGLSTDNPQQFPPRSVKVKRFVRKGIPPDWRGAAWFYYAGGPAMVAKHPAVYRDLTEQAARGGVSETDSEIIERDLHRTFPDNIKFKPDPPAHEQSQPNPEAETAILQSLRRVLEAFAIYNPKIGYCQSLNFLAGLLLLFMDEEKSFWMLNIITRVYLPATHELNLEGANVDLGVLMTSIKDMMPSIWAKIGGELDGSAGDGRVSMRLPPITLCTTAWFMSCFIGTLPIETTLRVWDSFFYEGSKTLFRIALTIFKVGEAEIKAVSDPMEIFQVVQGIPRKLVDANALLEACFRRRNGFGHLSQETIERGRAERRQGYADERAKAAGQIPTTPRGTGMGRRGTLFGRKKQRAAEGPNI